MHCHGKVILGFFDLDVVDFFNPGKMTQEEIGEVMGLSRKTVGKKLVRLENRLSNLSQFQNHLPSAKKGAFHVR
jgi:predicted DNA-binding protein (UPF0251 family)